MCNRYCIVSFTKVPRTVRLHEYVCVFTWLMRTPGRWPLTSSCIHPSQYSWGFLSEVSGFWDLHSTYIAIVGFVVTKSNHSQKTLWPLFDQCWFWVQLIIASPLFAHNMGASTECKYRECSVCTNYYKICKLLDVHQDMRLVLLTNGPYAPVIGGVFAPDWRWSV